MKDPIHVLLIEDKEAGYWSAQCLEYDIATQAKDFTGILNEVHRAVNCHITFADKHKTEPFAGLRSAPSSFWKMYYYANDATAKKKTTLKLPSVGEHDTQRPIEGCILQPC